MNSYVRYLGSYRSETLSIVASHPVGLKDVLVETSIEGVEGAANPVWRVRAQDGQYKIIDVSIDGVSLAQTQRQEFAAVINRKGLDGLLEMLREKLAARAKAAQLKSVKGELSLSLSLSLSLCQHPRIAQCEQVWDSSGAQVIGVVLPSSSPSVLPKDLRTVQWPVAQ